MLLNLGVIEDLYVLLFCRYIYLEFFVVLWFGLFFIIYLLFYGLVNFCIIGMVNLFYVFIYVGMWYRIDINFKFYILF